jgi:phosphatidylinositol glycan class W
LSVGHLQDWILNAERVGLLTSNKEGLCSLFGYTAIFCIGRQLGSYLFYPSNRRLDEWRSHVIPTLTCLVSISWSVFYILNTYFDCFPSRRMVNAMYILCTSAFNLTSILLCLLTEQYCLFIANKPTPLLLESINHNQLAVFLIANLLTGLINKSMYTLYADNWTAICVLLAYTIITVLISLWLHSRRIYLRL